MPWTHHQVVGAGFVASKSSRLIVTNDEVAHAVGYSRKTYTSIRNSIGLPQAVDDLDIHTFKKKSIADPAHTGEGGREIARIRL